jgi:hypothetical protein
LYLPRLAVTFSEINVGRRKMTLREVRRGLKLKQRCGKKFGSFARHAYSRFRNFFLIKGKAVVPVHAIKAYVGGGVVAPLVVKKNTGSHLKKMITSLYKTEISRAPIGRP